ncbi:hypothetical protein BKA66DRAFT_440652 [Pyrenochaeta sp. MPI-SDFR-AT-0127]|nr:hypothetical protein BKA66DRAFT_440652 [Pyrenochaeta sp. MPI-SDFR-AT-0127]
MSFKAKDLQFDNSQPAFLRRLRGELTGDDSARHEQPIPRNKRMKQDDEDDAPTYVLEDTNQSLTKEEYDALVSGKDSKESDERTAEDEAAQEQTVKDSAKPKDKIVEVGANAKKRKAAKIISDDHEKSKDEDDKTSSKAGTKPVKKPKKKAKAVKLTFGDEDEG